MSVGASERDARTANLLGALALSLTDAMEAAVVAATDRAGSGPAALVLIHDDPGRSIESLRRGLALSQSGAVRAVDALEAGGLLVRRPGPDGRTVSLQLTAAGDRSVVSLLAARANVLDPVLGSLDADARRALGPILERILAGIVRDDAHAERVCRLCEQAACPLPACPVELAI